MLKQRILTVAVLLPLFLAALFALPNRLWGLLLVLVLILAAREWARLAGYGDLGRSLFPVLVALSALAILFVDAGLAGRQRFIYTAPGKFLYGLSVVFWLVIAPAWLYSQWRVTDRLLLGIVGWVVLVPFWHAMVWLQLTPVRMLVVMGVVWTADIAAYFAGRAFGRRKLAPQISPGKTWEGVAGALIAVVCYWMLVSTLVAEFAVHRGPGLVLVALLLAVSVQGDLFESWLKRMAGLKDSGALLPGHGGVLDRVDALTSALPLAALYFAYPVLRS